MAIKKIQEYASKIASDVKSAAKIFSDSGESWDFITVPDVYCEHDYFYTWYYNDYIDLFDTVHSKDEHIDVSFDHNGPLISVSYGYFDSKDLYNYGDDENALYEFVQSLNYMDDLYFVTTEFGYTIADLAKNPYEVFEHFDDEDRQYYSEEVLSELDLFTQSNRLHDLTPDAKGITKLYKEVSDYFSYDNAEKCLAQFMDDMNED